MDNILQKRIYSFDPSCKRRCGFRFRLQQAREKSCAQVFNIHVLRGSLWMNLSGILHKSAPQIHARINTRPEPILKPPQHPGFPWFFRPKLRLRAQCKSSHRKIEGKWRGNAESSFTDHCLIMNNAIQDSLRNGCGSVEWERMRMSG